MNSFKDATLFIDLSYLSAEEESVIRQVLLRDEDLKRLEIGRVRRLRNSVPDTKQLKFLSGEWFEDLRAKRYGRQPASSAVVRSSMRWKKSAGHKPMPFLNDVVLEEKMGEQEENTRSQVTADPRSIHPALSAEVSREYQDKDFTLEVEPQSNQHSTKTVPPEEPNPAQHNIPIISATVRESQSAGKPKKESQEEMILIQSSKLEPGLQPKPRTVVSTSSTSPIKNTTTTNTTANAMTVSTQANLTSSTSSSKTSDTASSTTSSTTSANTADGTTATKTSSTTTNATASTTTSIKTCEMPSSTTCATASATSTNTMVSTAATKTSSTTKIETASTTTSIETSGVPISSITNSTSSTTTATTKTSTAANAEPQRDMFLPPVMQKDKLFEENWVKTSQKANTVESKEAELKPEPTDGNTATETLEITSFSKRQVTPIQDQSAEPGSRADSISFELKAETGERMSSKKVSTTEVKQKQILPVTELLMNKEGSGLEEGQAQSQSLPKDPKETHELLIRPQQGQESSPKLFSLSSAEMMKKQTPPSNTVPQIQTGEIRISDFPRSSPTRMDELEEGLDNPQSKSTAAPNKPARLSQSKAAKSEMIIKNAGPEINKDFDVELKAPERADDKTVELALVSKINKKDELPDTEIEHKADDGSKEERRNESENILAGVYARALRAKSTVPRNTIPDLKLEEREEAIPSIVIVPSESEEPKEKEKAPAQTPAAPSFVVDTWEDEGVDSDDEISSVSSYGSDRSGRRGFSASTLSVTERTGSLLSVYSEAGDFGDVAVQGSVEFALMYSPLGELIIMVEQCQDLAVANPRKQRTDPYVKTYLYPDKRSKRKTSIKKRTLNPVFVESLRYKVKREELPGKTLNLSVWHNDPLGRNVFLGQVEINLRNWDWGHQALTWYNLQPKTADNQESQEYYGLLSVSLKYVPPDPRGKVGTGEIHIWLREARQLRRLKVQGVDSFVKCYMLPDTSKKSRQKTRVVKKSLNPVYNHTMVYDGFRPDEVREACCELTVWDSNKLSHQFLGGVRLGLGTGQSYGKKEDWMDSRNEEVEIWEKMLASPSSWVESDLPLRASMTPGK